FLKVPPMSDSVRGKGKLPLDSQPLLYSIPPPWLVCSPMKPPAPTWTFPGPLVPATLKRRYKRFLADVALEDGTTDTAHCPNTGSMKSCWAEGDRVWLLPSHNPKRKLRYTWELTE